MLLETDTVLEVDKVFKLYSRKQTSTRKRATSAFNRILFGRSIPTPKKLLEGEFWSLRNISFTLKRGEAIGVIGLNGAGKTTLLRVLSGQILPDKGEIRIMGKTAAMIDLTAGFSGNSSGRRNIFLRGAMLGRSQKEIEETIDEIIEFSELGDAIDAPFSTYSSGMCMRLAFSLMIVSEPDILFIDEILSVGDFQFRQKCLAKIRSIRERVAFVLVSHSMANIKLFCNSVIVLNKGEIMFQGEPEKGIAIYESLQFPEQISKQEKRNKILRPQYNNTDHIKDVMHLWCDKDGHPIDTVVAGQPLFFKVSFELNHTPRNLIIGLPVWTDQGVYVTGFSTSRDGSGLKVEGGKKITFMMEIQEIAFNAGEYISNIAIHDGPEFLYRGSNPSLHIESSGKDTWGIVSLKHSWSTTKDAG